MLSASKSWVSTRRMLSQSSRSKFQLPFSFVNLFSNGRSCFTSLFIETDVLKTRTLLSFIKSGRLYPKRTQIHKSLSAVVDFIVNKIEDGRNYGAFIHSKKQ